MGVGITDLRMVPSGSWSSVHNFQSEDKMTPVFVYGTLRKGRGNHHILQGSTFKGQAKVKGDLYREGFLPVAKQGEGVITGEVYEVDDRTLKLLDRLEGHPGWYRRELVPLLSGVAGEAWIYFYPPRLAARAVKVESGDYVLSMTEEGK